MSLRDFIEDSDVKEDWLYEMIGDVDDWSSNREMEKLDDDMDEVRAEIDRVNEYRGRLGSEVDRIEHVIEAIRDHDDPDLELQLLKAVLVYRMRDLQDKIYRLRPNKLLQKKVDLRFERRVRDNINEMIMKLTEELKDGD